MVRTLLFDMDNTLLIETDDINIAFVKAMNQCFSDFLPPNKAVAAFLSAQQVTDVHADASMLVSEIWQAEFSQVTGRSFEETRPAFDQFIEHELPKLRRFTRPVPQARPMMEWIFAQGFSAAIATGALLPLTFLEQRLEWVGVPVTDFPYAFLTTWDNMHAGKLTAAYYHELVDHLKRRPEECLMVGDHLVQDMSSALAAGIPAYWIIQPGQKVVEHSLPVEGQGTLEEFYCWLQSTELKGSSNR